MSPGPPAVPPAAALDSGGDTQRLGGLQKMGRGRGFAWEGAAEEEEDGTEHPWGAAGGCPTAGNPPCSPVLCVPASRAGGARACPPPGPRDPRPRRGTTPGTIRPPRPPRPGLPLTRSLHRQHPDSSVCSFVCFKYIYILYIYKHPYLFGGLGGSAPPCRSRRSGAEGLKLPGEPDPSGGAGPCCWRGRNDGGEEGRKFGCPLFLLCDSQWDFTAWEVGGRCCCHLEHLWMRTIVLALPASPQGCPPHP